MTRPRPGAPAGHRRQEARLLQERRAAAARRRRTLIQLAIVGGVAVIVIAIVATAVLLGRRTGSGAGPAVDTTVTVAGSSVPFAVTGSAVRLGPAEARARVDLWVDYSCPHCQEFEAVNSDVLAQLVAGGDVSVSFHNIQIVTEYGTAAGGAAACVAALDPERWYAFNASLYANHSAATDGWTNAQLRDFASQQGVTGSASECIAAGRYTSWIAANTEAAATQGVQGTPTLFLNGQPSELLSGPALRAKVTELAGR